MKGGVVSLITCEIRSLTVSFPAPRLVREKERKEQRCPIVSLVLATKQWAGKDGPISRRSDKRCDDILIHNEIVKESNK